MFQFTNFLYDPSRDGYQTEDWSTIAGTPTISSSELLLNADATIHRADILHGEVTMNINIPTSPQAGDDRKFGFCSPGIGAYAWFAVSGADLKAQIADGDGNVSEATIAWSDGVIEQWDGADTEYRIIWEAGLVHFEINDTRRATLSGAAVPKIPMSIYLNNTEADNVTVQYINAISIQSFYKHSNVLP